jgi:putative nucleotidyltransferase with HDIG domain
MSTEPTGALATERVGAVATRSLPARAAAASRILAVVDDPDTDIVKLTAAVVGDPTIAARVIALANSAYYGLSRRVATVEYSISVVGFQAVRAIALPVCLGLDGTRNLPPGFWQQAAMTAAAAGMMAPSFGVKPAEAFCAGLLHTIGSAALHQERELPALCLPFPDDLDAFNQREVERYGIDHAAAGAQLLAQWHFPAPLCELVANHHHELEPDDPPLNRVVHVARVSANLQLSSDYLPLIAMGEIDRISDGRVTVAQVDAICADIAEQAEALVAALS